MRLFWFFMIVFAGFVLFSCSDDEDVTEPIGTAPDLPPANTLLMEFETFALTDARLQSFQNAVRAGSHIVSWRQFVREDHAIPLNALLSINDKVPEKEGERWKWSYEFTALNNTYSADLYGVASSEGSDWEFYVSQSGVFSQELMLKGSVAQDRRSGTWALYDTGGVQAPSLEVKWTLNDQLEVQRMTYSHLDISSITYELSEGNDDASYKLTNNGNHVSINWNRTKKDGEIVDPAFFQDEQSHCWNVNFEDIDCL